MESYSIVIPVYKSSKSLEIIADQVLTLKKETGFNFELVFVNDSPDFLDTEKTLAKIKQSYHNVKLVTLRKNQGQQIALLVGLNTATGDYIITMDDDLQHPVCEIPKLLSAIKNDKRLEAVFAIPNYKNKKHSLWRNICSYIINKADMFFLRKPKGLIKSPFRIITKQLSEYIVKNHNAVPALSSLIINATNNIINIEVTHNKRKYGRSNYSLQNLIKLAFSTTLNYSALPLKIISIIGLIGFLFSVIFILSVVTRKLLAGIDFPGYASTVTLISFFGGLNLFAVGIIGEYLIRIIKEQQKSPLNDLIKEFN